MPQLRSRRARHQEQVAYSPGFPYKSWICQGAHPLGESRPQSGFLKTNKRQALRRAMGPTNNRGMRLSMDRRRTRDLPRKKNAGPGDLIMDWRSAI